MRPPPTTTLTTIRAMADPTRFAILRLLRDRERAAGDIARQFDTTRPAVSTHLRILHRAGLLSERRAGTRRLYAVRPQGFAQLRAFIEGFWDVRLQRLKHAAEADDRTRRRGRPR